MELKIEYLPLEALTPYERNARKHEAADVETIKNSIREFEMCDPIGIWGDKNIIVEGHGRLMALQQLGHTQAPCIRLDHLTDEQRRAYALAHNKTAELSAWDFELVESEIAALEMDMAQFGFDIDGIEIGEQEIIEDEAPEIDEEAPPVTQLGDIWQLGRHRLLCGDSTDALNINLLMNGQKADLVFTDPPYGYEYQSNMRTKSKKFEVLKNDDKILDFIPAIKGVCGGFVFICTTWKVLDKWLPLFNKYYELSNMIIWDKGGGGMGDLEHTFLTDYEIILCSNNGAKITGKRLGSVWDIPKDDVNGYVHATQKPVKLPATAIENTTNERDNVLDVFGGSGSTLIACEQLNRTCFMIELDPKYCDVIVKRWETLTGEKAVRL